MPEPKNIFELCEELLDLYIKAQEEVIAECSGDVEASLKEFEITKQHYKDLIEKLKNA